MLSSKLSFRVHYSITELYFYFTRWKGISSKLAYKDDNVCMDAGY